MIAFLKRLYNAAMDSNTPTFREFEVRESYNERRVTDILLKASQASGDVPGNHHCTITRWYHPITNEYSFTLRVKSRNHDWRMRRSFFTSVENELRYY